MVDSLPARLLDALLPQTCCLCQWPARNSLPLCPQCRAELPANPDCCARCALPLSAPGICGACQVNPPPFDRALAPWLYGEYLAHIIQRWKFGGEAELTGLLADLWLSRVDAPPEVDVLVPVPLHWRRQWRRGYNQAELLAARLGRELAIPVRPALLRRHRYTAPQSGMDAVQRARNLRGAFTAPKPCDNLRVAAIDDVLTTAATAREVARVLRAAGARRVEVWCLARTPAPAD